MPRLPKHIAVTAGMVAALGAFGAGAYALSQGGSSFDPSAFISSYDTGGQDRQKGYQANRTESDAQANRSDDDNDRDTGADTDNSTDTPAASQANVPAASASGTTAVRVTGDGSGTGVNVANGSASSGGGTVVSGPVIPGGTGSGGDDNNGGGNGANQGGGGTGGNQGGGSTIDPTENSYRVLPVDPVADEKKPSGYNAEVIDKNNDKITGFTFDDVHVSITGRTADSFEGENDLYVGQKLDAWTVFCALDAAYYDDNFNSFGWACKREQFDSYPYFRIDEYPEVVPAGEFQIKVSYRINDNDGWHEQTVSYYPAQTCVFFVNGRIDKDGSPEVYFKSYGENINLDSQLSALMVSLGYLDNDDPEHLSSHMLLGWEEAGKALSGTYTPTPGRHVIEPGKIVKVPQGCSVQIYSEYIDGVGAVPFQTLVGVKDSSEAIVEDSKGKRTLNVPRGVTRVKLSSDQCLDVDIIKLPDTVESVDCSGTCLRVNKAYKVDKDNALYASTDQGVLTNKAGTEYYGIPADMKKLVIPAGVTSVNLPESCSLRKIEIERGEYEDAPAIGGIDTLKGCYFIVDDDIVRDFLTQNQKELENNTVALASRPNSKLVVNEGVVSSSSQVALVLDSGSSWAEIGGLNDKGGATLLAGCLDDNPTVQTLVLSGSGHYTFDDGCLEGGSVDTIVCNTFAQCEYVESRIEAAGAPGANVVLLEHNDDGFYYYREPLDNFERGDAENAFTLFKAPKNIKSFEGTFETDEGDVIEPVQIASRAFKGCDRLEWVQTAESTFYIGAEAFKDCDALQGVLIGCRGFMNIEPDAFASCANTKFIGCRSMDCETEDTSTPNSSCLMYAPTGAEGYNPNWTSFTVESNIVDYAVAEQDDGSLLLCGVSDADTTWIVLACGSSLKGEVKLPEDTLEIFSSAFSGVDGPFTVNWSELSQLSYVDANAFSYSGLAGDVYVGSPQATLINIQSGAFEGCSDISSFESDAFYANLGNAAFSGCTGLTRVRLAASRDYYYGCTIEPSLFYGCSKLHTIEMTSSVAPSLVLFGTGMPFAFDGGTSPDEDAERIKIEVPEGSEQDYLAAWGYFFCGYADFDDCYSNVRADLMYEMIATPTDAQVKTEMSKHLLEGENRLRKMLGMHQVKQSTLFSYAENDGCTFETNNGVPTLASVPIDAKTIDFSRAIPDGMDGVVIPAGAFSSCTQLERVVLSNKVSAIQSGAFTGCDGVMVSLPGIKSGDGAPSIKLTGGDDWTPFEFGGNIKLDVSAKDRDAYLAAWPRQMLGLFTEEDIDFFAMNKCWVLMGSNIEGVGYDERLRNACNTALKEQENILRAMMGADAIDDYHDICSFIDTDPYYEKYKGFFEPEEPGEWPDWSDSDAGDRDDGVDADDGDDADLSDSGAGSDDAVGDEAQGDKDGQHDDGVDAGTASGEL